MKEMNSFSLASPQQTYSPIVEAIRQNTINILYAPPKSECVWRTRCTGVVTDHSGVRPQETQIPFLGGPIESESKRKVGSLRTPFGCPDADVTTSHT
jgi:hypothetical protein